MEVRIWEVTETQRESLYISWGNTLGVLDNGWRQVEVGLGKTRSKHWKTGITGHNKGQGPFDVEWRPGNGKNKRDGTDRGCVELQESITVEEHLRKGLGGQISSLVYGVGKGDGVGNL